MNDESIEDVKALLHQIADRTAKRDDAEVPLDDDLEAFAEGRLSAERSREITTRLAHSPEARHRLFELRGVDPVGPSPELRRRVLSSASNLPARRAWMRPAVAALAALLLVAIGWGLLRPKALLPAGLDYVVDVYGVSEVRDGAESARLVATAGTQLRFEVAPRDLAESGVAFAIYKRVGESLEKVPAGSVVATIDRGAATLRARAGDILGTTPGSYSVWVVVARPSDLPAILELDSGTSPADALAAGGRRWTHRSIIELVSDPLIP